jgi:hypothetical protein
MNADALLAQPLGDEAAYAGVARRLLVTWQHPESRLISPVGLLDFDGHSYRFRYIESALTVAGFRPFLGLRDLKGDYRSTDLFPLFDTRVMSPRRPDYGTYLGRLGLSADASPMEILARSEGRREADTVQLFPVPEVAEDGRTSCQFLVHGVRYVLRDDPDAVDRFDSLRVGQPLHLVPEPQNPVNARALLTTTTGDSRGRLGWAPNLLLDYLHAVRANGGAEVSIAHINGPEAPLHLRLAARVSGVLPPGYRPFCGPGWEPLG